MTTAYPRKRRGFWLFFPFFIFALIVGIYSAYWFWARDLLDKGIDEWIATERAAGRTVEYSGKRLGGYPFRFALHLDDPVYGDPANQQRWQGEQLQLVMQPWDWQHVIARSPGRNEIMLAGDELQLDFGPKSAGSLSWTNAGIRRVSIAIDALSAANRQGPLGAAEGFEFHLRPPPGEPDMLQLQTQWEALSLARPVPDAEFLGTRLGPSVLRAQASKAFTALEVSTQLETLPRNILAIGGEITLAQLVINWGPAQLGARGRVDRTDRGEIGGQLGLRIEKAEELKAALSAAGRLDSDTKNAIDAVAAASRNGSFLELSVREDGLYFLGNNIVPARLGAAF